MATTDPVLTAAVSIASSLATTVIALFLKETFDTQNKISRMMLGLCIDCSGTIQAFESEVPALVAKRPENDVTNILQSDFAWLRTLPSGFVVSPPLGFPKELVNLLPSDQARTVFLYFDAWERYTTLEGRYRDLFQIMLSEIADASAENGNSRYMFLRDERVDNLSALADDLYRTIHELMARCCEILVLAPCYLDHSSTESINRLTQGRWNTWQEIRDNCKLFHKACGRVAPYAVTPFEST